ncbi:hypothetical protein QQ045_016108 [Rhodiola kirilowii]
MLLTGLREKWVFKLAWFSFFLHFFGTRVPNMELRFAESVSLLVLCSVCESVTGAGLKSQFKGSGLANKQVPFVELSIFSFNGILKLGSTLILNAYIQTLPIVATTSQLFSSIHHCGMQNENVNLTIREEDSKCVS